MDISTESLWQAWERVQANAGCGGSDGVSLSQFGASAERAIPALTAAVSAGEYRPYPLLKLVVQKKLGSKEGRTLLVPAIRDRILQTAMARQLSRSFEDEFLECSFGYRPGRSVDRAIARVRRCQQDGFLYAADADIQGFFDHVDHARLLELLAIRVPDRSTWLLLRSWVHAEFWDGHRVRKVEAGLPQGSPISPLFANLFLQDFDRELEATGRRLIRYADDFLILAKTEQDARDSLTVSGAILERLHLQLNLDKTRIATFEEGFQFLGALFQKTGIWIPWKTGAHRTRVLFMAYPMPPGLRFEYSRPAHRTTMEEAFAHVATAAPARTAATGDRLMAYLYISEQGAVLRKSGDRFLVDKEDHVLLDLPYHHLENVLLFGNIQVTAQAMGELLEKGVRLSLFNRHGTYRGSLQPKRAGQVATRLKQFAWHMNDDRSMGQAARMVNAKIRNGLEVLTRYRERQRVAADRESVLNASRERMEHALAELAGSHSVAEIDGHEGNAAQAYFTALMLFNRSEFEWPGRLKHPANDPLNALLSLTYTLLTHELDALIEAHGLDSSVGFLHQIDQGRPSLALDLAEAFRHPLADRFVMTAVNRKEFAKDDFAASGEGLHLRPAALNRYFAEYEKWMLGKPEFRALLRVEVERFTKAVREETWFEPYLFGAEGGQEAECNTSSVTI